MMESEKKEKQDGKKNKIKIPRHFQTTQRDPSDERTADYPPFKQDKRNF